jgi:protein O-mannosyl-transferase
MEELFRRQVVAFCALLLLFITICYGNTLYSPFTFDDRMVIKTEIAQSGDQYFESYPPQYRHLFYLSLAINYAQGKLDPFGYHLVNISLHFLTSLVLFFITYITILRGAEWGRPAAGSIAALTTLLFALSPVHTETVTYISGRTVGLAGLFYFSSLLFYIVGSFRERTAKSRLFFFLLSVFLFVAAVLSKETSLTLPAIILLYDFCFMNGEQWPPRKTRLLYFYLPLFAGAGFAVWSLHSLIVEWLLKIDFNYALQQTRIVGHAMQLLLFPVGLTFDTDFPDAFFPHPALRAWPLMLLAGLIASVARHFPKAKKISLFCVFWFLFTLAPTNSFLPRLDLFSERNLYIPSFGIFLLLSTTIYYLYQAGKHRSLYKGIGVTCLASIFIFHAALLVERNAVYRANAVLWQDTAKKAPGKTRVWQNLSHHYLMESNYKRAFESIQGLMKSNPTPSYRAQAQSKLGIIHSRQGHFSKAIAAYEEAIRLDPSFPIHHLNIAGIYARMGIFIKANEAYEIAEQMFKSHSGFRNVPANLYLNKANILFRLGLYDQAETAIQKYMAKNPGSKSGHAMLGNIYAALGKSAEAAFEFSEAKKVQNLKQ